MLNRISNRAGQMIGVCLLTAGISATAFAQGTTHVVELHTMTFEPAHITIETGDTVRWIWVADLHNVESGVNGTHDGNFTSGAPTLPPNAYQLTFDQDFLDNNPVPDNVYPYYCIIHWHMGMSGSVTVVPAEDDCPGDLSGPDGAPDGTVDVFDLIELINQWGPCADPRDCPADLSGADGDPDGTVDVFDLIELINNWGSCSQ